MGEAVPGASALGCENPRQCPDADPPEMQLINLLGTLLHLLCGLK